MDDAVKLLLSLEKGSFKFVLVGRTTEIACAFIEAKWKVKLHQTTEKQDKSRLQSNGNKHWSLSWLRACNFKALTK